MPSTWNFTWRAFLRPQDAVWLLLFAVLAATSPVGDAPEIIPLVALALAQVLEPKIPALGSPRGRVLWIMLKLALAYLLIGYTGGIQSRYWLVLLLPVVSAATALGPAGALAFTVATAGVYLTFVAWVDWATWFAVPGRAGELVSRIVFLAMIGNLANMLMEDLRKQSQSHRHMAEKLAEANLQLRDAEDAVRRADRLAALGQLTAGLAHEMRNPLGTIKTSAEMLNRSLAADNEVAREVAGFIVEEADRTNSLITRFLQFARPLQLRLEQADLAQALDRAAAMAQREAPAAAIYKNYSPEIPPFPFDQELMERVFYNLILNAAQASPEGGAVTVKTRAAGGVAEVAVIDRGCGIAPQQRDNIFNPFFTTKPSGVGLGLAIVAKIVDEHGGKIAVESEHGKGSVFRVLLPMEPAAAAANEETNPDR